MTDKAPEQSVTTGDAEDTAPEDAGKDVPVSSGEQSDSAEQAETPEPEQPSEPESKPESDSEPVDAEPAGHDDDSEVSEKQESPEPPKWKPISIDQLPDDHPARIKPTRPVPLTARSVAEHAVPSDLASVVEEARKFNGGVSIIVSDESDIEDVYRMMDDHKRLWTVRSNPRLPVRAIWRRL